MLKDIKNGSIAAKYLHCLILSHKKANPLPNGKMRMIATLGLLDICLIVLNVNCYNSSCCYKSSRYLKYPKKILPVRKRVSINC